MLHKLANNRIVLNLHDSSSYTAQDLNAPLQDLSAYINQRPGSINVTQLSIVHSVSQITEVATGSQWGAWAAGNTEEHVGHASFEGTVTGFTESISTDTLSYDLNFHVDGRSFSVNRVFTGSQTSEELATVLVVRSL